MDDTTAKAAAQRIMAQMAANRNESFNEFLAEMPPAIRATVHPSLELAMHQSYDIGYTDALIALMRLGMLRIEAML
jgi:hypothetical protein